VPEQEDGGVVKADMDGDVNILNSIFRAHGKNHPNVDSATQYILEGSNPSGLLEY